MSNFEMKNKSIFFEWIVLFLALFSIIFFRAPEVFLFPALQVEDGVEVFSYSYVYRDFPQVFRFYSGYMSVLTNFIGYLSIRIPTSLIPLFLCWTPLLIALVSYSRIFSDRYAQLLPSRSARGLVAVLFALAPLSMSHFFCNTNYSIWNMLFLLILMSVVRLPEQKVKRVVYWLTLNVLVWGHPLAILILPFQLYYFYKDEGERYYSMLTIFNLVLHQRIATCIPAPVFGASLLGTAETLFDLFLWSFVMVGKIFFRTAFGPASLSWAENGAIPFIILWEILIMVFSLWIYRGKKRLRKPLLIIFYVIFAQSFLCLLGRGIGVIYKINHAPTYIYIQSLASLVLYMIILDRFRSSLLDYSRRIKSLYSGIIKLTGQSLFVLLLSHYLLMNVQVEKAYPLQTEYQGPYHYHHPLNGFIVQDFFAGLEQFEKRNGTYKGNYLQAIKVNDWPILVDTRPGVYAHH